MAKTVYLGMIGDIMHPGYINIINKATEYGDVIIGLFTDKAIANHRRLPYLTWEQRKNVVESIRNVSRVVPQDDWSYVSNLLKYKPDYIIHGDDWQVGPDKYIRDEVFKVMEKLGGEVIEIPYTQNISASGIKQEIDALGVTPQMRLSSLRRLIAAKPIVRILESHNGLTGLIAEHTKVEVNGQEREFDGMWASSLTDSTSKGKPDIEAVDLTTRLHDLNDTLEVTTKPVIFDGDTGGKIEHFGFTVRTLERLGISCVNRDTKEETLKCLYYTDEPQYALLAQLLKNCGEYDKYILVGGYLYEKLGRFVKNELSGYGKKIELVYNEHFKDYGSGYSLYKGIEAIKEAGDVTFVEGDLFFMATDFRQVYNSPKSVITINREPIYSNKAVALYINVDGKPRYLYDTNHQTLTVSEPFKAIFNSGQMWKFSSSERLLKTVDSLTKEQLQGTNLEIIQAYFSDMNSEEYDVVTFTDWFNCNTVADYDIVRKLM